MRLNGTIVTWKDDKGFGFIEPADGGARIFCHLKAFEIRVRRPLPGDRVTYEVGKDSQGRLTASRIRPVGLENAQYQANIRTRGRKSVASATGSSAPTTLSPASVYFGVSIFAAGLIALVLLKRIALFVPFIYLGMSLATWLIYAFDKSAAMNRRWRTEEQTLHLFELLGGWPGAWVAQAMIRHKSRKQSFRMIFTLCAAVNVTALLLYAIPEWAIPEWRRFLLA
jgi:uncharacterized membrane protein YsdA (DUF1294 family)/cold shock CspA family protein